MPKQPLWLRKSAGQIVAQWTARKAPSQWCEDEAQRDRLITNLCLELIFAISQRIPDQHVAAKLLELHQTAIGEAQ